MPLAGQAAPSLPRHRLSGHLPAVDLRGTWSYVMGRPVEGSLPRYQATPEWLVLATLFIGLIAMPVGFFALRLRIERRWQDVRQS